MVFLGLCGLNVVQRFLLAVARYPEAPQQPGLFQPVALLNVIQLLAHAQYAFHVVIRLVRVNHGQIQAHHGVRAGNAHLPFPHLNRVVAVARHRLVNEGNRFIALPNRNLEMLRHDLANARMLGDHHVCEVVVFQPLFQFAGTGLGIHRQHVKVRYLCKQRLLRFRQMPRIVRNGVPPEKHQVFVYERVAHRAKQAHFLRLIFAGVSLINVVCRGGASNVVRVFADTFCGRLERPKHLVRSAAVGLQRMVLV